MSSFSTPLNSPQLPQSFMLVLITFKYTCIQLNYRKCVVGFSLLLPTLNHIRLVLTPLSIFLFCVWILICPWIGLFLMLHTFRYVAICLTRVLFNQHTFIFVKYCKYLLSTWNTVAECLHSHIQSSDCDILVWKALLFFI